MIHLVRRSRAVALYASHLSLRVVPSYLLVSSKQDDFWVWANALYLNLESLCLAGWTTYSLNSFLQCYDIAYHHLYRLRQLYSCCQKLMVYVCWSTLHQVQAIWFASTAIAWLFMAFLCLTEHRSLLASGTRMRVQALMLVCLPCLQTSRAADSCQSFFSFSWEQVYLLLIALYFLVTLFR